MKLYTDMVPIAVHYMDTFIHLHRQRGLRYNTKGAVY